jgi:cytochrome b pre-mRNA-processing protein 3
MAFNLLRRRRDEPTIAALYGAIVAQARQPAFYADYGVPDTVEGRFDMIVLHLALLVRRLRKESAELRGLGQQLFDTFCADMDRNLREMGYSDTGVPRRMRRFGEAFYGRAAAYDRALDESGAESLAAALARNVFGRDQPGHAGALHLAAYVIAAEGHLARQPAEAIVRGSIEFPAPAAAGMEGKGHGAG